MPLPLPDAVERGPQLFLAFPGDGQKQSAVDVPSPVNIITDAPTLNSKNYIDTALTVEDIFDCLGEDPADTEVTRILYRLPIAGNFYAPFVSKLLAYAYGVAGAFAGARADTEQTITIAGGANSGTLDLALTYLGGTETARRLPWNATVSQLKQLIEALPNIGFGNTVVTLEAPGVYKVKFIGKRASANVPAFVPTNNTNGTVAVAVTVAGGNKSANITRNPDYQNPYFSFIVGFRDNADSHILCYNAIVNNVRIVAPAGGGIVTFEAELIFSGKTPLAGYTAPDCYVPRTVRTSDCAFSYDGADQTRNLVSQEFVYDNGTLTGDHAYTGRRIVPSRLERANRRTSAITVTLAGRVTDAIYLDAAPPFRKGVPVVATFGTEGENTQVTAPNATWQWSGGNSGVSFEGEAEESRLRFLAAPKRAGVVHPTSVVARYDGAATLLAAA